MKNDTDITVIIPAYNAEKTIERCIDSIIGQTLSPKEIIIINDGSTDNTIKKLKKYINHPSIRIFNKSNEGVSIARNYGLDRVRTKYVTFVDSDDYVNDNFLKVLMENYHKSKNIDLSICGVTHYNEPKQPKIYNTKYEEGIYDSNGMIDYLLRPNSPQGYLCNKLWKMDIINHYNLRLDSRLNMAEDLLFTITYLLKARNIFVSNSCLYNYMHYPNSLSSGLVTINENNFIRTNEDFLIVCKKIKNMSPNIKIKKDAAVFFARNASFFLRQLNVLNDGHEQLKKRLLWECKKNLKYVLFSNTMNIKNKLAYISVIYFSPLILNYDRHRGNE